MAALADLTDWMDEHSKPHVVWYVKRLPAPLGRRALAYLRLFAPEHKSLSMAKAGRLLTELQAAVAAGQVRRTRNIAPVNGRLTAR